MVIPESRLQTGRLALEPLGAEHAAPLFSILWDVDVRRWIADPAVRTVDALAARWGNRPAGSLGWAVREGETWVGKLDAEVEGRVATNVGYQFAPAAWGRGIGTEAVGAMVTHLERAGVVELRATVTVGNVASARLLERLGFERRGVLVANDVIRGVPHDDWLYVRG